MNAHESTRGSWSPWDEIDRLKAEIARLRTEPAEQCAELKCVRPARHPGMHLTATGAAWSKYPIDGSGATDAINKSIPDG